MESEQTRRYSSINQNNIFSFVVDVLGCLFSSVGSEFISFSNFLSLYRMNNLLIGGGCYKYDKGAGKIMSRNPLMGIALAVGIILLFIGVTVAPSINFNIVTESDDKKTRR